MGRLPGSSETDRTSGAEDRLTKPEYWNSVYESQPQVPGSPVRAGKASLATRLLSKLAGTEDLYTSYADDMLLRVLLPKYFQRDGSKRILEIGAAPATALLKMHERFGFQPFGVEYTPTGAQQARNTLENAGFSGDRIFECDAFSEQFKNSHREAYDVVMSLGFIEHFTDVRQVIRHHMDLLAPGGLLLIRIPRLRGVNYLLARTIDPASLEIHNLEIMKRNRFRELFDFPEMEELFCDYEGTMHLLLSDQPHGGKLAALVLAMAKKIQVVAGAVMHRAIAGRPFETAAFSPFLLYIGRKR